MTSVLSACIDLPVRTFNPGEALLTEGGTDTRLYILIEGSVIIRKGQTEVARIAQKEAIFGEIAGLLGIPHSASVIAETTVTAYEAPNAASFIESSPAIACHAARVLAQRLTSATTYLADLKAQFADQSGHFAMMDQILDELMQQQKKSAASGSERGDDPRL